MNLFKLISYKTRYYLASYAFFPLTHDESTEFLSSKPQELYPSRYPPMLDTGLNDYNVITPEYLHEFYYGDLGCFKSMLSKNMLKPTSKSSSDYKKHYQKAIREMTIECKMIKAFAHKRLITITDIEKLFNINQDEANQLWNAPFVVNLGYPVDKTLLSKLKYNVYNSILSKKTIHGFKRVNHNDIAFNFSEAIDNYNVWKLKVSDIKWNHKHPNPSEEELIDHYIDIAGKNINLPRF